MNKFRLILLICFVGILNSQSMADLDNLPPEIRKSVLERMERQNGSIDPTISPEVEDSDADIDEYIEYLKSEDEEIEIDEYGSEIVKRFGYDLFEDISDQTPLEVKAAPANYILGPGDELRFNFSGSIKKTIDSTIDREGEVFVSELGSINFSGLSFSEAKEELAKISEATLIGTSISMSLINLRSIEIFVTGNAKNPGSYVLNPLSTISNVLFNSGGPTDAGSLRNIELRRNNKLVGLYDFYELFIKGNTNQNLKIQSGDALLINPVRKSIKIFGEVNRPAIYELKEDENFINLLNFASGLKLYADENRIVVTRVSSIGDILKEELTISEAKNLILSDGDSVFVHKKNLVALDPNNDQLNMVSIKGEVKNPGSYPLEPGERLSDLIIKAGGYNDQAYIEAGIFLRQKVAEKEKEALSATADQLEDGLVSSITTGSLQNMGDASLALDLLGNIIKRLKDAEPVGRIVATFDLNQLAKNDDLDLILLDQDQIIIPKISSTVSVTGQVLAPATFVHSENLSVYDYIDLAGGFTVTAAEDQLLVILPNGQALRPSSFFKFKQDRILPGSTIIVNRDTTSLSRLSFWRSVLPIFSSLITSLAAIDAIGD
jgi:protein involved in polysaccharide export with SLBB domain